MATSESPYKVPSPRSEIAQDPLGQSPHMLRFVLDVPNAMTLAGLSSGVLSIFFAAVGNYSAAMIGLLWSAFFDWFDGPVAKMMKRRPEVFSRFGGQLDSLSDMVTAGVAPAFILLSIGSYHPLFLPGAIMLIFAGAIRLSFFNVYGLREDGTYSGVPIGINAILVPLVFLLHGVVVNESFQLALYAVIVLGAALNVAPIRFLKLTGGWYVATAVFVLSMTVFYAWRLSGSMS